MTDTWSIDNDIVNGINDSPLGYYTLPEVFSIGENIYLISIAVTGVWNSFRLSGDSWDNDIISGLTTQSYILGGDVFTKDNNIYFIAGDYHINVPNFYGFKTPVPAAAVANILGISHSAASGRQHQAGSRAARGSGDDKVAGDLK